MSNRDTLAEGKIVSATVNTAKLNAKASTDSGAYDPGKIYIIKGTGIGQSRSILEYNGATQTVVIDRDWKVALDTTSEYYIVSDIGREHINEGLARAGSANTITLNTGASADTSMYTGQIVFIRSGTGSDQSKQVLSYDGTTKVATLDSNWIIIPDATSAYVMLPTGASTGIVATNTLLNTVMAQYNAIGTFGNWMKKILYGSK